jgi:hypothetical protein
MIEEQDIDPDIAFNHVRRMLSDISSNFCFIILDEDGDLFYDYTNHRIGKMLMSEALDDMGCSNMEIDWDDLEDDDEDLVF